MCTVPTRSSPELTSTDSPMAPLLLPLAPEITVIHGVWLAALHSHSPRAVTFTVTPPPEAAID